MTTPPTTLPQLARAHIAAIPVWRCCPAGSWQPSVCAAWGQHDVGLHDVGHLTEIEAE